MNGLQWMEGRAGPCMGPPKTLLQPVSCGWSRMGVFRQGFFADLAQPGSDGDIHDDSTHLKAHRTAASLPQKGDAPAGHRNGPKAG